MSNPLLDKHRKTLDGALEAIRTRGYWSAYPEIPSGKIYGESAKDDGIAAFKKRLNNRFALDQPTTGEWIGAEQSPYGFALDVQYPQADLDGLIAGMHAAWPAWREASIETRVGVCLEILQRLNQRSFELAAAVMHTTGQGFMMAFQAGGPHAQDRGLEGVAYACAEMQRVPLETEWTKQVSKTDSVTLRKRFHIVPRGIALVIGCSTFPTWNSYSGLFASLATGNPVVVKPHPGAVLPLAITVETCRDVLRENGFDPNLVTLLVDTPEAPITDRIATHPEVRIIDYTGGSGFGQWLEQNAKQAVVFTEKAGVNCTVVDGVDDLKGFANNLAFSLCLYSGQMCTTPQNIFIPRDGIEVGGERKSFDEVASAVVKSIDGLLGDAGRACEVLGALQNEATQERVDEAARGGGQILRPSQPIANEQFPDARVRSPLVLRLDAADEAVYLREMFGPIAYVVATDSTEQSLELAERCAKQVGAITCGVYAKRPEVLERAERVATSAGVPVSYNLTGPIYVNQSAAFSDYHVSGANPAGNATLTDGAYVSNRFRVVQTRAPA